MRLPLPLLPLVLTLGACSASSDSGGSGSAPAPTAAAALTSAAALGEKIFKDTSLSASGRQSCASCHSPEHAHAAPPGDSAVSRGGANLQVAGFRNAPSLRYLAQNPAFFYDDDGTPTGGFNRDGRADSLAAQARRPFLAAHEMANASATEV